MNTPIAVYVHIPFCPSKCGYCDFNSYALSTFGEVDIVTRTVHAIEQDILRSSLAGTPAKTIFFGGGTPTFLPAHELTRLLEAVYSIHPPITGCEITSEANPGTVDATKFRAMVDAGFNRISLGAQSFLDADLLRLERVHTGGEIERAVQSAREAGFHNVNLDLMFALPGQGMRGWRQNLARALALEPEHLSLYCLTIEPNTRFYTRHLRGQLDLPDDDDQVAMYDEAVEVTRSAGYEQYEISNFAKPGFECRHNLEYWRAQPYAAYGPGAVGATRFDRSVRIKHPVRYCEAIESHRDPVYELEPLGDAERRLERLMLGLRLTEGLPADAAPLDARGLVRCKESGWLREEDGLLRLTPEGRHFCSEVALALAA